MARRRKRLSSSLRRGSVSRRDADAYLGWKISVGGAAIVSVLFIVGIGMKAGFTPRVVTVSGILGATIGAVQGPVWCPDDFRFPLLWQLTFGALGGTALGYVCEWSPDTVFVAAGVGSLLALLGIQLLRPLDHF